MTDYATLSDGTHTATFIMDKDWRPAIEEVGAKHSPLGYPFFVKSTGGTKGVGGSFDIVSDNDTDTATVITILKGTGQLTLTLPNGDSYAITLDPATPLPAGWRSDVQQRWGRTPPELMTDGADLAYRDWRDGYDPSDDVDRAIRATRDAVFPHLGLDSNYD